MAGRIDPIATHRPADFAQLLAQKQPRTSYRHLTEMIEAVTVFKGFLDELELELSQELSSITRSVAIGAV